MGGGAPKSPPPQEDKAAKFAAENRKRTGGGMGGFRGTILGSMLDYGGLNAASKEKLGQ
jgi:hypothetical protein